MRLEREFKAGELAETYFNSVTTKVLHRSYFQNDYIFIRPAVNTEYIENDESEARPAYRAYHPQRQQHAAEADADDQRL